MIGISRRLARLSVSKARDTARDLALGHPPLTVSMLPHRLAVGQNARGQNTPLRERHGWALAALLPIGYTRTHLPAYEMTATSEPLPFFGYSAVAGWQGRAYVAGIKTDDPERWVGHNYPERELRAHVEGRLAAEPENRVLRLLQRGDQRPPAWSGGGTVMVE